MTEHFDVVVVGGQLSGLIAGALLAKRGRRVALIDQGEGGTSYRRKGLRLPFLPTLVPALDGSPPVQRVHDELGVGPDLRAAGKLLDPVFQAVLPGHRIDIHAGRDALLAELGLEFPGLAEPVARFFERLFALDREISAFLAKSPPLPPRGMRERWRVRSLLGQMAHLDAPFASHALLDGIPVDHALREVLLGPLTFFGHLWATAPSTFHAVRLIARTYRGGVVFPDRVGGLTAMLLQAAERAGVTMRRGVVVKSLTASHDRLREIEIDGDRHATTADFIIANTLGSFQDLLPAGKLQARYGMAQQVARAVGGLMVMNLVVKDTVIPRGMAEAVFLLNGRRRVRADESADPPLFVRRFPAWRGESGPVRSAESLDDAGHTVLSVACPVRIAEVAHSPDRQAALKLQVMERIGRLVPFLRTFMVDTSLPADTAGWDVEGDDVVRRLDPWQLHPIFESALRPVLGVAMRSPETVFRNLVYCGRDVVPGLGLEGEYMTALAAADLLAERAGKQWTPAR